jgi:hypothetical protein
MDLKIKKTKFFFKKITSAINYRIQKGFEPFAQSKIVLFVSLHATIDNRLQVASRHLL